MHVTGKSAHVHAPCARECSCARCKHNGCFVRPARQCVQNIHKTHKHQFEHNPPNNLSRQHVCRERVQKRHCTCASSTYKTVTSHHCNLVVRRAQRHSWPASRQRGSHKAPALGMRNLPTQGFQKKTRAFKGELKMHSKCRDKGP